MNVMLNFCTIFFLSINVMSFKFSCGIAHLMYCPLFLQLLLRAYNIYYLSALCIYLFVHYVWSIIFLKKIKKGLSLSFNPRNKKKNPSLLTSKNRIFDIKIKVEVVYHWTNSSMFKAHLIILTRVISDLKIVISFILFF